jgi:hypothetical protein
LLLYFGFVAIILGHFFDLSLPLSFAVSGCKA